MADRLVVRTERLAGHIRVGWRLASIGLLLVIVGGVVAWVTSIGAAVFAYDRAEVGSALSFDGSSGDYSLLLLPNPLTGQAWTGNLEARISCTGISPDRATISVDGAATLVRNETDAGTEIGRFTTTAGVTEITCDWKGSRNDQGVFYSVAPVSSVLSLVTTAVMIGGVVVLLVGAAVAARGYRGRAVVTREP